MKEVEDVIGDGNFGVEVRRKAAGGGGCLQVHAAMPQWTFPGVGRLAITQRFACLRIRGRKCEDPTAGH